VPLRGPSDSTRSRGARSPIDDPRYPAAPTTSPTQVGSSKGNTRDPLPAASGRPPRLRRTCRFAGLRTRPARVLRDGRSTIPSITLCPRPRRRTAAQRETPAIPLPAASGRPPRLRRTRRFAGLRTRLTRVLRDRRSTIPSIPLPPTTSPTQVGSSVVARHFSGRGNHRSAERAASRAFGLDSPACCAITARRRPQRRGHPPPRRRRSAAQW
jgi:hypothetical protein